MGSEHNRGRGLVRTVQPVQQPESLGSCPESDTGHDVTVPGHESPLPVLPPESDAGRGVPVVVSSDLGLSSSATLNESIPVIRRERRNVKPVDRLVVEAKGGSHLD